MKYLTLTAAIALCCAGLGTAEAALLDGMFGKPSCGCPTAPSCCAPVDPCCAPAEPTCCAPVCCN
ncbi:MAG: hypothetical protein AAGJ97_11460 [Planctomycetota bacterium]